MPPLFSRMIKFLQLFLFIKSMAVHIPSEERESAVSHASEPWETYLKCQRR